MKKKNENQILGWIGGFLLLVMIVIVLLWNVYTRLIARVDFGGSDQAAAEEHHYVIIPENNTSLLWDDIKQAAVKEALASGAYLDSFEGWVIGDSTALEYMKMAIAAEVDGIIVKPDGTKAMRDAINLAGEKGIPVITIMNDESKTGRKSFVGPNSYQIGTVFGQEIQKCIKPGTKKITVVFRQDIAGKDLIMRELKAVLLKDLSDEQKKELEISDRVLPSGSAFDYEEVLHDLLLDEEKRPDILVCLNDTDSTSAYHAMIDYNLVGSMDLIGYYHSNTLLDAIGKGTVPCAITVDTEEVGKNCIDALEEYYSMGYVSNYFSIGLKVVEKDNYLDYLNDRGETKDEATE